MSMNEWEWQLLEDKTALDRVEISGIEVRAGHRVRLRPRQGGDVFDIALDGQTATIEAIEQDYEGKLHICVVLDEDPGRDLGLLRQPGHRFFFDPGEVEPLDPGEVAQEFPASKPWILVAGIGNIFFGDDAFGVEVVKRMAGRTLPVGVRVADFGIRGYDLAYALQDGYETTILVDACPRGDAPGTLYVVEPDVKALDAASQETVDAHTMNPMNVLRMARSMNIPIKRILLVGCEPASLGGDEGQMGLSEPVEKAVDEAIGLVESLLDQLIKGNEIKIRLSNSSRET
jgi:hydrogenase maturation protease